MTVSELRTLVDNLDEYIHIPGGIDRLKKMVLHLAVSGQLVPQDPSEGTGEELYRQIQAEKAELVKQGKIKKQSVLPAIDRNEELFVIPASWIWARLNSVIDVRDGTHDTPKLSLGPNTYPLITSKNFNNGVIDFASATRISREDYLEISKRSNVEKHDILFSMIGGNIGNQVMVTTDDKFAIKNVALFKYYNHSFVLPRFLKIYTEMQALSLQAVAAGGAQPFVSLGALRNLPFPLPPKAEQKRIVAKLDRIFELIEQLAAEYNSEQAERSKLVASSLAQLAKAEDGVKGSLALTHLSEIIRTKADVKILRQTILHLAVSGQLVPRDSAEGTGEELFQRIQAEKQELIKSGKLKKQKPLPPISKGEAPFTTPNGWKWARLGDLSDIFNGNSINASEKKLKYEKVTAGYPYIATKDIGYGFENVDYENGVKIPFSENKFKIISEGTALICSEGGSAGKKCGIVDRDVAFGNKMYAFKVFGGLILPEFVLYNYLSKQFYEQFSGKMTGIIGGISTANFKQLLMPLPPLAEQKRIVARTTQLLDLVAELERHLEK